MDNQAWFQTTSVNGVGLLTVFGEVDVSNVSELARCLEEAAGHHGQGVIVDLTRASYFDSRTIALLADFGQASRSGGRQAALVAPPSGFAARLLEIAGLAHVVPTYRSVDEALASILGAVVAPTSKA